MVLKTIQLVSPECFRTKQMELVDANVRANRERFVSGHDGTSLSEITLGASLVPLSLLIRSLLWSFTSPQLRHRLLMRYFYDFCFLGLPFIVGLTIGSDFLSLFVASLCIFSLCYVIFLFITEVKISSSNCSDDDDLTAKLHLFLGASLLPKKVPFVTSMIYSVHIFTMVCILAVDFHIFPRRFAKTEKFGCSVMDLGVGAFIFVNGLVSSNARKSNLHKKVGLSSQIGFKQLLAHIYSCLPLLVLGFARLISVKLTGYQQHVSEYGLHWNFFFTLVLVKVFSGLIFLVFSKHLVFLLTVCLVFLPQTLLTGFDFTSVILSDEERIGLLSQNKEGLFSSFGFLSIYLIGVFYGSFIFSQPSFVSKWLHAGSGMFGITGFLWLALFISQTYVQTISRRMANLSYVIWVIAHCSLLMLLCLTVDLIISYFVYSGTLPEDSLPNGWIKLSKLKKSLQKSYLDSPCLMAAVNRNQLFVFLLSNILTGLVNFCFDTLSIDSFYSTVIISIYTLTTLSVSWVLHIKSVTVKFW